MSDTAEPARPDEAAGDGAGAGASAHTASAQAPRPVVDHTVCLCAGLGPLLTQTLRTLTLPEEVKRTVQETEREGLRLLRTLIDMRLSNLGGGAAAEPDRGTKVEVE